MKSESQVTKEVLLAASRENTLLLRNNSGVAHIPDEKTGRVRYVRYGLGNESGAINKKYKSSDLIGITKITITEDMVGKTIGVFTAIEVKKEGWKFSGKGREAAQEAFHKLVRLHGGIAKFVSSSSELNSD